MRTVYAQEYQRAEASRLTSKRNRYTHRTGQRFLGHDFLPYLLEELLLKAHLHAVLEAEDEVVLAHGVVLGRKVVQDLGARGHEVGAAELVVLALLLKRAHVDPERGKLERRRGRRRPVHVETEHGRHIRGLQAQTE